MKQKHKLGFRFGSAIALTVVLAVPLLVVIAGYALAQEDGGCVFDGRNYPEGYEMCQSGSLMRCEEGAWAPIGMCLQDDSDFEAPTGLHAQSTVVDEVLSR